MMAVPSANQFAEDPPRPLINLARKESFMDYGYARVSAKDQSLARQLDALRELGLSDDMIFTDKASGKDFNRPSYRRLMRRLKPGDVIFVKSIDRLGRNYQEIIEEWRSITQKKGAHIVVLDMPLLGTRNDKGGGSRASSSPTWCFSSSPMSLKWSERASSKDKPRASHPQRHAASDSEDPR